MKHGTQLLTSIIEEGFSVKNYKRTVLFGCAIVLICIGSLSILRKEPSIKNEEVIIQDEIFNPANYKQYASYMTLGTHNGKLYVWNPYKHILYCYNDDSFSKLARINGEGMGIHNGFFYYRKESGKDGYAVYCYDLETGKRNRIVNTELFIRRNVLFMDNGTIYVPTGSSTGVYYLIDGTECICEATQQVLYRIGENNYALEGERESSVLFSMDPNGEKHSYEDIVPYGLKTLIPCDDGLVVHNETNGDFLYFIEADTGNALELFTTDCIYAYSAVTIHDGFIYLSFVRYTEWGPLGIAGKTNENDELNGTYRISLEGYSVQKISDEIYNGLFVFNDSGIFACNDDMQVFLLNFDGTVKEELTHK